jgi:hypothetical protein
MSLGLSFLGGLANRRKEVIDSQRAAAEKRSATEHRIGLETAGRIEAQTTIDKTKLDAERDNRREVVHQLAVQYKRNNPSTEASVADISAYFGGYATNDASLYDLKKRVLEGHVKMGQSGMSFTQPQTPQSTIPSQQIRGFTTKLFGNPESMPDLLKGIAQVQGITIPEAVELLEDMNSETRTTVENLFTDTALRGQKSGQAGIFSPGQSQYDFGIKLGESLGYDKKSSTLSTLFGISNFQDVTYTSPTSPTSANSSVKMANRPAANTVTADGNSTNSAVYAPPNIGDIVTPPGGPPSIWTNATGDNRFDNPKNWKDPDTGKPRA